jgi:hypothetical protein
MIQIRYSAEETEALLNTLRTRMGDLRPVMDAVGQIIQGGRSNGLSISRDRMARPGRR